MSQPFVELRPNARGGLTMRIEGDAGELNRQGVDLLQRRLRLWLDGEAGDRPYRMCELPEDGRHA